MKKALCPLTKKPMDCKECKVLKDEEYCPMWEVDDWADRLAKFTRRVVENEQSKNT